VYEGSEALLEADMLRNAGENVKCEKQFSSSYISGERRVVSRISVEALRACVSTTQKYPSTFTCTDDIAHHCL
jgi:hypothetical protein